MSHSPENVDPVCGLTVEPSIAAAIAMAGDGINDAPVLAQAFAITIAILARFGTCGFSPTIFSIQTASLPR
jgi:hypothetical protein